MKTRKKVCVPGGKYCLAIWPMEAPLWRTEAVRVTKSWTPPIRIEPKRTQSTVGSQPNQIPANTGPTMGPAAAIAEKCWPRSKGALAGTKSRPSLTWWAGVVDLLSSPRVRPQKRPYVK